MIDSAAAAGLTLTAIGMAGGIFAQVLPSTGQVAGMTPDRATTEYVRRRATSAVLMVSAIGAGSSLLARSVWPAVGASAVAAYLWVSYLDAAQTEVAVR